MLASQAPLGPRALLRGRASIEAPGAAAQAPPAAPPPVLAAPPSGQNNVLPFRSASGPSLLAANLRKLGQLVVPPQLPGGPVPGAGAGRAAEALQVSHAAELQVRGAVGRRGRDSGAFVCSLRALPPSFLPPALHWLADPGTEVYLAAHPLPHQQDVAAAMVLCEAVYRSVEYGTQQARRRGWAGQQLPACLHALPAATSWRSTKVPSMRRLHVHHQPPASPACSSPLPRCVGRGGDPEATAPAAARAAPVARAVEPCGPGAAVRRPAGRPRPAPLLASPRGCCPRTPCPPIAPLPPPPLPCRYVIASTPDAIVVAFLGTMRPADHLVNLHLRHAPAFGKGQGSGEEGGRGGGGAAAAHAGYLRRAAGIPAEQLYQLARVQGKRLVLAGGARVGWAEGGGQRAV